MNQEAFPKDLDQPGYTLLVMKMEYSGDDKRYKKSYEKAAVQTDEFVKTLKFPAIAVTKQELASGKYDDANKYRYLLQPYDEMKETTVFRSTKPQGGGMHTDVTSSTTLFVTLYFTDRKENRAYPSTNYPVSSYLLGLKYATAHYNY